MKLALVGSAAVLLALAASARATAAPVIAVLAADHGIYRRALEALEAALGAKVPVRLASGDLALDDDTKAVVAIGGRAALRSYPSRVGVVYCLAPALDSASAGDNSSRVRGIPRPDQLVAAIKSSQPKARALAVLWSQEGYAGYAAALEAEGARVGLNVISVQTNSGDLGRALSQLEGGADAVWLAPDPLLVTPADFALIGEFSRRQKAVFYAPMPELVGRDAAAAVAVSPEEIGRTAAGAVKDILAGRRPQPELFTEHPNLVVDPSHARASGVTSSTDAVKGAAETFLR